MTEKHEDALNRVNPRARSSDLRITDMRFVDIAGAPMHCSLIKIYTNQGLVGLGELRDGGSKTYALMLKSRILGENPCNVDQLFRRIKQFGGHGRMGGGVSGVEVALWDLVGKAYGVPVYQLLGGRFRDRVRMYCDTDAVGKPDGKTTGAILKKRMEMSFTLLKMDFGMWQLLAEPGTLSAPAGTLEDYRQAWALRARALSKDLRQRLDQRRFRDACAPRGPFSAVHFTEKGLDRFERHVADVRSVIGDEIPLAIDHLGDVSVEDCIRLARRLERYNLAWLEDPIPWFYTDQYVRLRNATAVPICTGEDIYLKENFKPLLERGGVSVVHPDLLTAGGVLETKKIGDLAQDHGVPMAIHMAESPVGCMAAAHVAAATENFLALEFHSVEVPWWNDIAVGLPKPIVQDGFITVPDKPGLGIDDLNDDVLRQHLHPDLPGLWEPTNHWDNERSYDRTWS